MLSAVKYQPKYKTQWDHFVSKAKNATFLFYRDFMEYHQDRLEDYSLMVFDDEKLISIIPANNIGSMLHSHQGLTYGGLVITPETKLKAFLEIFRSVLMYLYLAGMDSL